tara:strand:+ start:960 stop:1157 length:198 start_codon:yes stop_codon:yes gene_type:complete
MLETRTSIDKTLQEIPKENHFSKMERYTKKQSPNSSALATYETNTETFEKSESLKADKWKNKVLF